MKSFKLSASLNPEKKERKSGFSKMAGAVLRMVGGMLPDGQRFRIDGSDFGLAFAQLLFQEAEVDVFVMGAALSVDGKASYVAIATGEIWKFAIYSEAGRLVCSAEKASDGQAAQDCVQSIVMQGAVKKLALSLLVENGLLTEDDSVAGHVVIDTHAAVCMRPYGYGVLLLTAKDGTDKGGWKFAIDGPRNLDFDNAKALMQFQQLTEQEVAEFKDAQRKSQTQTVDGSPFPQKIGQA